MSDNEFPYRLSPAEVGQAMGAIEGAIGFIDSVAKVYPNVYIGSHKDSLRRVLNSLNRSIQTYERDIRESVYHD